MHLLRVSLDAESVTAFFFIITCSVIKFTSPERELSKEEENSSRLHSFANPVTSVPWRVYSGHQVLQLPRPEHVSLPTPSLQRVRQLHESQSLNSNSKWHRDEWRRKPCSFILNSLTVLEQERWINFSLPLPPVSLEVFQLFSTISSCVTLTSAKINYECLSILSGYNFPCTLLVVSPSSEMDLLLPTQNTT